jgi:hypothetical protein
MAIPSVAMDGPPEIPAAPSAPRRPWLLILGSGVVCFAALSVLVSLAKDRGTDVPPTWLFAASGIVVAGVGGIAVWFAALQSRLVVRSAIALAAGFACIAIGKFALAPLGFFEATRDTTIETFNDQESLIWVTGFGVLLLYVVAIRVVAWAARMRLKDTRRVRSAITIGTVISLAAIGVALPFLVVIATGLGPLYYLRVVFTSTTGLGVVIVLTTATGLVAGAFVTAEDRAQVLARASMLTSITWLAIAFVILFQALWIVFMLAIVGVWPLRTVTPK